MESKIGARELFALICLLVGSKAVDMTPTILSQDAKNAFWMIPFVSFIVFFPSFLLLLHLLNKFQDKNLLELMRHLLGKHIGNLLGLLLFVITMLALISGSRSYVDELNTMYFQRTQPILILGVFLGTCFFGAKRGFQNIGATSWTFMPYIKLSFVLMGVLVIPNVVWHRVFPIWGEGLSQILLEGVKKGSMFSELFVLTMAYTSLKSTKAFHKGAIFGGLVVVMELAFFYLLYCVFFDYNSVEKAAFPFHELSQTVEIGDFFTNIETFFLVFWLLAAFVRYSIYLYVATWIFGGVFNIKRFEPLLLPFAFLTVVAGIIPNTPIENALGMRETFLNSITILFVALPFLLWVVAKSRGELKQ